MRIEEELDYLFTEGKGSSEDSRFKFQVGQKVIVSASDTQRKMWSKDPHGHIGVIESRRNAYPPPHFTGYWFPIYFISDLGEIGEDCLTPID